MRPPREYPPNPPSKKDVALHSIEPAPCGTCGGTQKLPPVKYPGAIFTRSCPNCVCQDCGGSGRETEECSSVPDGDGIAAYDVVDVGPCPTCATGKGAEEMGS